jgi:hypothetical protein
MFPFFYCMLSLVGFVFHNNRILSALDSWVVYMGIAFCFYLLLLSYNLNRVKFTTLHVLINTYSHVTNTTINHNQEGVVLSSLRLDPLVATNLFSVHNNSAFSKISHKWNHIRYVIWKYFFLLCGVCVCVCVCVYVCVCVFELRTLHLLSRCFTFWAFSYSVILETDQTVILLFYTSCCLGMTGLHHLAQHFFLLRRGLKLFLPQLAMYEIHFKS